MHGAGRVKVLKYDHWYSSSIFIEFSNLLISKDLGLNETAASVEANSVVDSLQIPADETLHYLQRKLFRDHSFSTYA